ncbi:acyl carrier protein [Actinomadura gamaensis]|uniref:Acyl carrier protein n=1 Tax=Actinomadura gamaensis TaxID=1763541 RepID=A0ABV9TV20_9ACTN
MNENQARALVLDALAKVAPDVDTADVSGGADLRDDLGLDSMDFLAFVELVSESGGCAIDEDDYPAVSTVDGCVDHLVAVSGGGGRDADGG